MQKLIIILLMILVINQVVTSYKVMKAVQTLDKVQYNIGKDINKIANAL